MLIVAHRVIPVKPSRKENGILKKGKEYIFVCVCVCVFLISSVKGGGGVGNLWRGKRTQKMITAR